MCVCVCVRVYVCVCLCERERDRQTGREGTEREVRSLFMALLIHQFLQCLFRIPVKVLRVCMHK